MSGRYLYCQAEGCGVYLGSMGGNFCPVCDWVAEPDEDELREEEAIDDWLRQQPKNLR